MIRTHVSPVSLRPFFTLLLCFFSSIVLAQHSWTRTNPGGGGSTSMMGATANGAALVIGSDLSGVYISRDDGKQWKPLGANNGLTSTDATALGFHATDENTFFVGSGSGLFRTTTGGNTFEKVLSGGGVEFIESVVGSKSNPDVFYVAQHRWAPAEPSSIYKSLDGGSTWQQLDIVGIPSGGNIVKLLVHPADDNIVYALTGRSRFACSAARLYRSENGGFNWNRIANSHGDILDLDVHPTNTNVVFVSTFETNACPAEPNENFNYLAGNPESGAFFRSNNAGSSFEQLSEYTGIISVGTQNPDIVRIVNVLYPFDWNSEAGTWESLQGGAVGTWSHTGLMENWFRGYSNNQYYTFNDSFYGLTKTVTKDFFNDDRLYGTFGGWAWASFDGGKHLNNVATEKVGNGWRSTGMDNINGHVLDVSDAKPDVVYMGGYDIGFWASRNHGKNWKRSQPDFNVFPEYTWNLQENEDGTVDPELATTGEGSNISTLLNDPARPAVVWASFSRGQYSDESTGVTTVTGLFKSTAHGQDWQWSGDGLPGSDNSIRVYGLSIDVTSPVDNRTLYVTVKGDVYKSTDDGASWGLQLALPGHGLKFTAVDRFDGSLVYAGGEAGLWRSVDAGSNWSQIGGAEMRANPDSTPMRKDIVPTSSLIDWSTGNEVIALYAWEGVFDIKTDPNVANRVYATVFGEGRGLYRSNNAGQTWNKLLTDDHMRGVAVAPYNSELVYVTSSESYHSGASNNSAGFRYSINGGSTWQDANDGLAWNYGGIIEIATGTNPSVWAWAPGTGVQFSAAAATQQKRCNGLLVTVDIGLGQTPTPEDDVIMGTALADEINGGYGADTICSGGGDDSVFGAAGDDWIDAGDGNDLVTGNGGIDYLKGGDGDDYIYGHGNDDTIQGGNGNDVIEGGGGNDLIKGGSGNDQINGDRGNDKIYGQRGNDVIRGGDGADELYGQSGDDELYAEDGDDQVTNGGGGIDLCQVAPGNDSPAVKCE